MTAALEMAPPAPAYGSAAWVSERASYVGASDVPMLLGVSDYGGPLDLYQLKTGERVVDTTLAMSRGHIYEDAICAEFGLQFPHWRQERAPTVPHPRTTLLRATPDRLLIGDGGERYGLEAKLVSPRFIDQYGETGTDDLPLDKIAQAQTQMEVCDLPAVFVAVNFGFELRWYRVERDQEIGRHIVDEAQRFMREHVAARVAPAPTLGRDTLDAITRRYRARTEDTVPADETVAALVLEFAEVKAQKRAADAREAELKAALAVAIGEHYGVDAGPHGRVVWPESAGKPSLDVDGLLRELRVPADVLQKFTRAGAPFRTMRYYPPKKGGAK